MNRIPILKVWLRFGFWKNLDAFLVPGFFIFAGFLVACTNDANFDLKEGVASIRSYNRPVRNPSLVIDGGEQYTINSVVNLDFNADGKASEMFISMDSDCSTGSWEPFQESKDFHLPGLNGETTIYVKYKYEQIYETDCVYGSIVHDNTPPELEFTRTVDSLWIPDKDLDISFQVSDLVSGVQTVECDFQGNGQFGSCQSPLSFSSMGENNNYLVKVRVWDKAGNSVMKGLNWRSDQTPPKVVFNNTPGKITSDDNPNFNFIATDTGSGVDTYLCRLDGQDQFKECENHLSFSNLQDGHHVLQVQAVDKVGNISDPIDYSWVQDKTVPSIRFTKTPAAETKDQQVLFQFSGVDNQGISSYRCKIDQGSYEPCSNPYSSKTLLSDGRHIFSVVGVDPAGNQSSPIIHRWRVDTSRPTIGFVKKPDPITRLNWAYFGFRASDQGSGIKEAQCSLDGANYKVCGNFLDLMDLSQGTHTLQVRSIDNAGNLSDVIQHQWQIDQSKPKVRIVQGYNTPGSSEASIEFSATDEESGVRKIECRLNGKSFRACESPMKYSELGDGEHSFSVRAEDKAGNVSSVESYSWLVDTQAPLVHFTERPDETVYIGSEARIQFTINDGGGSGVQSYQCFFNGEPYDCTPDTSYSFMIPTQSDNNFQITVSDRYGNSATEILDWKNRYELVTKQFAFNVNEDRPIDILFVIDNSKSMSEQRENLSERIDGFLQKVKGLDWQIGVISTEIERGNLGDILTEQASEDNDYKSGRLIPFEEDLYILHSDMNMDFEQFLDLLQETMQTIPVDSKGDEQAIYSTALAIERALAGQREEQFFRPGAHLSVVVLSDEDENSNGGYEKGVLVNPIQYTPSDFLTFAKNSLGVDKEILWHSIVIMSGDEECRKKTKEQGTPAYYGRHYEELSTLTGGVIGSICNENYADLLKNIGQTVKDLQNTISLECAPEDDNLDGRPDLSITHRAADESGYLDYRETYFLQNQKLVFDEYMEPGDYELKFSCRK